MRKLNSQPQDWAIYMYINNYFLSLSYIIVGFVGVTFSNTLDMTAKFCAVLLAIGGLIHLFYKINGQRLDNKIKQKELEE